MRFVVDSWICSLWVLAVPLGSGRTPTDDVAGAGRGFRAAVLPGLSSRRRGGGGLDLAAFDGSGQIADQLRPGNSVLRRVRDGEMPPEGHDSPEPLRMRFVVVGSADVA